MIRWLFYLLCIIFFFGWLGESYAAPAISGTSGFIVDGGSVLISGSGFGTHTLNIEWLGGASGHIESGSDGDDFSRTNWTADSTSGSRQAPQYSTARAHSYSKSIMCSWPQESQYDSTFTYDFGSTITKIYATFWYYFDYVDSSGQWKAWWIRHDTNIKNASNSIFFSKLGGGMVIPMCTDGSWQDCFPDADYSLRYWDTSPPQDKWVRVEIYAEDGDYNTRNGTLICKLHPQTSKVTDMLAADSEGHTEWIGTVLNDKEGVNDWQYFQFTGYWGNISSGDGTKEKLYYDDIYFQAGTRARVEIGDNVIWGNCTLREIQIPTAWSDTSITITVNRGSFAPCETYYLFVVDANGNVSTSYPIRIVTGAGKAPCPPTGLEIKQ